MSHCQIDHSQEDVRKKFESQREFLPLEIKEFFSPFFTKTHSQETLNEVFHLLKKYDLASDDERNTRNEKLLLILK